jgi:hypothetical protein
MADASFVVHTVGVSRVFGSALQVLAVVAYCYGVYCIPPAQVDHLALGSSASDLVVGTSAVALGAEVEGTLVAALFAGKDVPDRQDLAHPFLDIPLVVATVREDGLAAGSQEVVRAQADNFVLVAEYIGSGEWPRSEEAFVVLRKVVVFVAQSRLGIGIVGAFPPIPSSLADGPNDTQQHDADVTIPVLAGAVLALGGHCSSHRVISRLWEVASQALAFDPTLSQQKREHSTGNPSAVGMSRAANLWNLS